MITFEEALKFNANHDAGSGRFSSGGGSGGGGSPKDIAQSVFSSGGTFPDLRAKIKDLPQEHRTAAVAEFDRLAAARSTPQSKPNPTQGFSRFGGNHPEPAPRKNMGDWVNDRKALVEEVRTMSLSQREAILGQFDANYNAWKTKQSHTADWQDSPGLLANGGQGRVVKPSWAPGSRPTKKSLDFEEALKFNANHDAGSGKFSSGGGGAKTHDKKQLFQRDTNITTDLNAIITNGGGSASANAARVSLNAAREAQKAKNLDEYDRHLTEARGHLDQHYKGPAPKSNRPSGADLAAQRRFANKPDSPKKGPNEKYDPSTGMSYEDWYDTHGYKNR